VLSAGLVSISGDWILLVGLLYRVYAMTGSTVASALTVLSASAPPVLLGSVAGMFADRWDRKRTMIVADLLMAAGLLPLLAVHGSRQAWIVFAVLFWEGAVEQFFSPAQQAMVPRLVPDDQLMAANVLNGQVRDVSRLAGSALGGVIAALGGLVAVTMADAASFVVSAASQPLGVIGVFAVQGGGYVLAGLGVTIWLNDRGREYTGPPPEQSLDHDQEAAGSEPGRGREGQPLSANVRYRRPAV
jgi:MFS family permease